MNNLLIMEWIYLRNTHGLVLRTRKKDGEKEIQAHAELEYQKTLYSSEQIS